MDIDPNIGTKSILTSTLAAAAFAASMVAEPTSSAALRGSQLHQDTGVPGSSVLTNVVNLAPVIAPVAINATLSALSTSCQRRRRSKSVDAATDADKMSTSALSPLDTGASPAIQYEKVVPGQFSQQLAANDTLPEQLSNRYRGTATKTVSHQRQRSGQPARRTKVQGKPARVLSPWIEG